MPSSKKKNNKKKLLKGGKSCPNGSHKVCITTGQLDKLLKQVAVKKITKTRKLKKTKVVKPVEAKPVETTNTSFIGSIFGSNEAAPKVENEKKPKVDKSKVEKEPKVVEEQITEPSPAVEPMTEPMVDKSSDVKELSSSKAEKPKKETSFLGSIFGSNAEPATPPVK
jgi:hypothetical protein